MKHFWLSVSAVCVVAAGIALWQRHVNAAFVIATVGVLAWFLRYRSEIRSELKKSENEAPINDGDELESAVDSEVDSVNENS